MTEQGILILSAAGPMTGQLGQPFRQAGCTTSAFMKLPNILIMDSKSNIRQTEKKLCSQDPSNDTLIRHILTHPDQFAILHQMYLGKHLCC